MKKVDKILVEAIKYVWSKLMITESRSTASVKALYMKSNIKN